MELARQFLSSKYGKILKRSLKKCVYYFPEAIKFPFIRSIIGFKPEISSDIQIKIADSAEEIAAALSILHQSYREQGFLDTESDLIEINKYQLLPTSVIIIAKFRDHVVGTLTLVKQNPLGMPMERVFKGKILSDSNEKGAEITCLAIDRKHRRDAGVDVLFPLMKFMYHYAIEYFNVRRIFVACFPREADFYKSLLLFKEIYDNPYVDDYLGAPALGLHLDLIAAHEQYRAVYNKARPSKNLFRYFTEMQSKQLIYPELPFSEFRDSYWNEHTLSAFLQNYKNFKIPYLTESELKTLKDFSTEPSWIRFVSLLKSN